MSNLLFCILQEKITLRYLMKILKIILSLCFLSILSLYLYLKMSLPSYSGRIHAEILNENVSVIRDQFAIPHITAKNTSDLYKAYGMTIASDRLFQMDLYRRVCKGQLSEIFGKKTLNIDKLFRTLGFEVWAKRRLNSVDFPTELKEILRDFTIGVNYYINTRQLPYEFDLLSYKPVPFTMTDMLSYIGYMSYSFSTATKQDLAFSELKTLLSDIEYKQFLKLSNVDHIKTQILNSNDYSSSNTIMEIFNDSTKWLSRFEGSNGWLLSGTRTISGKSILANDPHIGFSSPGVWYEAHLKIVGETQKTDFEIYGHFLPLLPIAVLGHNRKIAWGLTMSMVDDMDLYKEKLNHDRSQVLDRGKWIKLTKRIEEIQIKNEQSFRLIIEETPRGVLLNEILSAKDISLKWSFFKKGNNPLESFYKMSQATNLTSFKDALRKGSSPGLNILYTDNAGNIAKWLFGAVPIRKDGITGKEILDANNKDHEYLGYIPFDEKPHIENPASGLIVSANQKPISVKNTVEGYWRLKDRYFGIQEKLSHKSKWTAKEQMKIQTNITNPYLKGYVDRLVTALIKEPLNPSESRALESLKKWNFSFTVTSNAASIYQFTYKHIIKRLLARIPVKLRDRLGHYPEIEIFFRSLMKNSTHIWWDNPKTNLRENSGHTLLLAFKDAIKELEEVSGKDINNWKWGSYHTLEFIHPLGKSKYLAPIFNKGPLPIHGAYNLINNFQRSGFENGFTVNSGPSTRRIIDFGNIERSYGILPLGISGHLLSDYSFDQLDLFLEGKYRKQIIGDEDIRSESIGEIIYHAK